VVSPTFRECCEKLGLVETDRSLDNALSEAVAFQMPCALRRMFATIMVFCEYTNIRTLWDKHFESMAEDYVRVHGNSSSVEQFVLRDIAIFSPQWVKTSEITPCHICISLVIYFSNFICDVVLLLLLFIVYLYL